MQKPYRFLISILFLGAYLLSACSGTVPQQDDSPQGPSESSESTEAVFTGTLESMDGTQWLISGQQINIDGFTSVDPNIQVGDIVKVEASVSQDGAVLALAIESSVPDDDANGNTANDNDSNENDDNANTNDNTNTGDDNSNDNSNANSNDGMDDDLEVYGVVEAITTDSVTIDGVAYNITSFTEFNDLIAVGDQVKVHVVVNADGTFTLREIEKSTDTGIGNDNDNSNDDDDSNSNSNDDDDDDDSSDGNSNDDD